MTVLVTGAAGFIGFHVVRALSARGDAIVGVDCLSDYYDVALKEARLAELAGLPGFRFLRLDLAHPTAVEQLLAEQPEIDRVVHLAAQPGVRYSLINPLAYIRNNIEAHVVLLEGCRRLPSLAHVVYASSSSVYGANAKLPFSVDDRTDAPASLYGATKKSMEVISEAYARTFAMPLTGLRFFTVYGPWGRPDMAPILFSQKIVAGEPLAVFNYGHMRRDFTYIDDIVAGVLASLDRPPRGPVPHRLYNLGNHRPEPLMDFVAVLEKALGAKARVELLPMQPGEMIETYADIEASRRDLGFEPRTTIAEGIEIFARWFQAYYRDRRSFAATQKK